MTLLMICWILPTVWPQCNQLGLTAAQENGHVVHLHYHYSASTMHKLIPRMLKMQSYIEKVAVSNVRSYRIPAKFPYQWLGRLPLVSFGHERWSARFESCSSKQAVRSALQAANALGLPPTCSAASVLSLLEIISTMPTLFSRVCVPSSCLQTWRNDVPRCLPCSTASRHSCSSFVTNN